VTSVINPLYVSKGNKDTTGFEVPMFITSQQLGCPVTFMQTSMTNKSMIFPIDIDQPVFMKNKNKWMVFPKDLDSNRGYSFYLKVVAEGGSSKYFGPYDLLVGCSI